jgi:hypothetical protein
MKVFLQILTAAIILPLFVILVFSSFVKFRVLDYSFWSSAYSQPAFQENINDKIDSFVDAVVAEQLSKGEMPKGREEIFRQQVTSFTQGFDKELVVSILDTNTKKILDFINGSVKSLSIYLPTDKLGIDASSGIFAQIRVAPNEFEVSKLLSHPSSDEGLSNLFGNLTKVGTFSTAFFATSLILFVLFLTGYFFITKKISSLGKLFVALGIFGFLLSVPVYLFQQGGAFSETAEPAQVILSIFRPILLSGLLSYVWVFSGATLFLGIAGVVAEKFTKKKKS